MKQQDADTLKTLIAVRIEPDQLTRLREQAKANERSVSQEVRLLIRQSLDQEAEAA